MAVLLKIGQYVAALLTIGQYKAVLLKLQHYKPALEPHKQVVVGRMMTLGSLSVEMVSYLALNARDMGSIPTLGTIVFHFHYTHPFPKDTRNNTLISNQHFPHTNHLQMMASWCELCEIWRLWLRKT